MAELDPGFGSELAQARSDLRNFLVMITAISMVMLAVWLDWLWLDVAALTFLTFVLLLLSGMAFVAWREYTRLNAERKQRIYHLKHE